MIEAQFSGEKITSKSSDAFALYDRSAWGEKKAGKVEYSLVEALFLLMEGKMIIYFGKNILSEEEAIKKFRKIDKRIETKMEAFSDLRKKGYIVKTALKYGADFRIYEKGSLPGEEHARWIAFVVRENDNMTWHDFAAKNRVAHSTKKSLLICVVDEEGDVSYYEVNWSTP